MEPISDYYEEHNLCAHDQSCKVPYFLLGHLVSHVRNHNKHRVVRQRLVCRSPVAWTLTTLSERGDLSLFGLLSPTSSSIVLFVLGMPNRGFSQRVRLVGDLCSAILRF